MQITNKQMEQIASEQFIIRCQAEFNQNIPEFSDLVHEDQQIFLRECMKAAQKLNLQSEQGIVSYAMGVWWLGENFEKLSKNLLIILAKNCPEARRIHAMNEWVSYIIGDPENIDMADKILLNAFDKTKTIKFSE